MKQSTWRIIALITLIPFSILTTAALWVDGVTGIFSSVVSSWGSLQIFVDLVIMATFVVVWIYRDAKAQGRNPWPWILLTYVIGAFSPLIYLLVRNPAETEA